ncbi:MAG: AAA family ATPase [Candidatus Aenigmatarchaeota archaeon]
MKIIGVVGLIGSGKDVFASHLTKKYGYRTINMGDIVREFVLSLGRQITRENLHQTQKEYRDKYGADFFGKEVEKKIKANEWTHVIIDGIRRVEDIEPIKKDYEKDFMLIFIEADDKIRFERLRKRKRDGDPKTFREFAEQERNEYVHFHWDDLFRMAEYKLDNNRTVDEFHRVIDKFVVDYELI